MTALPVIPVEICAREFEPEADAQLDAQLRCVLDILGLPASPSVKLTLTTKDLQIRVNGLRVRFPRWLPIRTRMLAVGRLLSPEEEIESRRSVGPDIVAAVVREALTMRSAALLTDEVVAHWIEQADLDAGIDDARHLLTLLLTQRRSVADRSRIARAWARERGHSMAEAAEAVLVSLGPPTISLEFAADYLSQLLRDDPHRDRAPFADALRALIAELGLHVPSLKLVSNPALAAGLFRIRINDFFEVAQPGLPIGHYLSLELGEGASVAIPAWRRCVTLREGVPSDLSSHEVWTPLSYIAAELALNIRSRAAALVDASVAESWVSELADTHKTLVAMFRARVSMEVLADVVRRLLHERVSVRNLAVVLERLLTRDEIEAPSPGDYVILSSALTVDQLSGLPEPAHRPIEFVRSGLVSWITRKPEVTTPVIILHPELERMLMHSPADSPVADHVTDEIALATAPGTDPDGSPPPVVLTSVELRARLRDMISDELPYVPVIAYQELPPGARVSFYKRIDLPPKLRVVRSTESLAETLQLLLADASGRPVMASGLGLDLAREVPPPRPTDRMRRRDERLWDPAASPNDLVKQQWGVIAPKGPRGDELLTGIAALVEHRRQAQGGRSPWIQRVAPDMNAEASHRWISSEYQSVPEEDRPRYLLILGDLDEVSLELQHALGASACVGRLAFDELAHYRAYADKAVSAERRSRPSFGCFLYAADDGTRAMMTAEPNLVDPCFDLMRRRSRDRSLHVDEPALLLKTKRGLLDGVRAPGLLVTVTHGVGDDVPYSKRRAIQGALVTGRDELLTGDDVGENEFLPDGIWFMFACYGAGTPRRSEYRTWVEQLCEAKKLGSQELAAINAGALAPEERPFVAGLPKRALANPTGPLAVIAHIDLAWTYSYMSQGQSRFDRIGSALHVLLHQQFAGYALEQLMRNCAAAASQLADYYATDGIDPVSLARAWMLRQDLRGFILLGDPATRLRAARS